MPFEYYQLGNEMFRINANEHALRSYWNSYSLIKETNLQDSKSYLLDKIINYLLHENNFINQPKDNEQWFLTHEIASILNYNYIPKLPVFATYLSISNPIESFKVWFIKCSVVSISIRNSLIKGPIGYKKDWKIISQRLFNKNKENEQLLAFGDKIIIRVLIKNLCKDFPIESCRLKVNGICKTIEKKCDTIKDFNEYLLTLTTKKENEISIIGIEVKWLQNIRLYTLFPNEIKYVYKSNVPQMIIKVEDYPKKLIVGQSIIIKVILYNGNVDLNSLYVNIDSDLNLIYLINPKKFYFNNIKAKEILKFEFLFCAFKPMIVSDWIFFVYKTNNEYVRYESHNVNIKVIENVNKYSIIPSFPMFSSFDELPLNIKINKLDKNKFELVIINISAKEIKNIKMKLCKNKKKNCFYLLGFCKKCFDSIKPKNNKKICFDLFAVDNNFPLIKLYIGEKKYVSDTSVWFKYIYDE